MKTISHQDYIQAAKELGEAVALKWQIKNNDIAIEIVGANVSLGACDNKFLLPAVNNQIKQLKRFLKGKKNTWE